MKLLFICNQNKHRSKTAELLFKKEDETKSAGLYTEKPVTASQLQWADVIIVMDDEQRKELAKRFPKLYLQKQILSLDIPDIYSFNQPELIEILKNRMEETEYIILATH